MFPVLYVTKVTLVGITLTLKGDGYLRLEITPYSHYALSTTNVRHRYRIAQAPSLRLT